MRRRRKLQISSGVLILALGLVLLVVSNVRTTSAMKEVQEYPGGYAFTATGYFQKGEILDVSIKGRPKWAGVISEEVEVSFNVTFTASDGACVNVSATYLAAPPLMPLPYSMAPDLTPLNATVTKISGAAPLSVREGDIEKPGETLGGTILRDGNLTVAIESRSIYSNFMSYEPPLIALRKMEPLLPYSFLLPYGLASVVLGAALLIFVFRRRERR